MSDKKRFDRDTQSALRIMEALSGVDEELLQRSEARRRPYWVYGRAVAACLALAVVGIVSWKALRMDQESAEVPDAARPYDDAAFYALKNDGEDQAAGGASSGSRDSGREDMADDFTAPKESPKENNIKSEPEADEAEKRGEQQESFSVGNGDDHKDQAIEDDESVIESCDIPLDSRKVLTQKEARDEAVFGAYLPETLPAGYTFSNAWSSDEGITVSWTRGMDYIMISVSAVVPEDVVTADLKKPETYDERLYEIPYADTVPQEYWKVFDNPVFAIEDLSLEVVKSRMKSVEDAGDTNTPRGMFSVLYTEGILVRFNGRGTAEEIWDMFCSVNR